MTNNLTAQLDDALARHMDQEPLPDILSDFQEEADALRPLLQAAAALDVLLPVELPDEELIAADRAIFMAHVGNLPPVPVSPGPIVRLKGWTARRLPSKPTILQQKEFRPMGTILFKAMLIFSMLFGAVGGTAALSVASQPDSPLYPLKLTVEGARLALAGQPAAQAALHLAFGQERAEEIAQMAQAGAPLDLAVREQLQSHWQQALQLMAQSPEAEMLQLLAQAQIMAQGQQKMLATAAASGETAEQIAQLNDGFLTQVRSQVAFGLQEPQAFRRQAGIPDEMPGGPNGRGPGEPQGPGEGNCETPGECDGDGPFGPGEGGYGPGPGDGECETPGDCDGDGPYGPGDGGHGPGPGEGGYRPGPGGPNGPGPGEGECETPGECDGEGPHGPQGPHGPGNDDPVGAGPGGPNGPGEGDGECETPGECDGDGPQGPNGPGNDDPAGPGPGGPNGPGDGEPNGPGNDDPAGPGPGGPNGPGDGEPNGPGEGDGESPSPGGGDGNNQNGDDNGQNGDDNGQNGDDNGQNGDDNGQNGDDNGQNGDDNGQNGDDNGQNGDDNGQNGGDSGGDNGGNGEGSSGGNGGGGGNG